MDTFLLVLLLLMLSFIFDTVVGLFYVEDVWVETFVL